MADIIMVALVAIATFCVFSAALSTWVRLRGRTSRLQRVAPSRVTAEQLEAISVAIKRLPEHVCDGTDAAECSVCLVEFASGDLLRKLPCQHIFHSACIDRWLITGAPSRSGLPTCPLCKAAPLGEGDAIANGPDGQAHSSSDDGPRDGATAPAPAGPGASTTANGPDGQTHSSSDDGPRDGTTAPAPAGPGASTTGASAAASAVAVRTEGDA